MAKGKCGSDCGECSQSCLCCDGTFKQRIYKKNSINFQTFKPYFDVTLGKVVESKHEINEYCKRNDMVYAGDKELTQQCTQNKNEREARFNKKFNDGLVKELSRIL